MTSSWSHNQGCSGPQLVGKPVVDHSPLNLLGFMVLKRGLKEGEELLLPVCFSYLISLLFQRAVEPVFSRATQPALLDDNEENATQAGWGGGPLD